MKTGGEDMTREEILAGESKNVEFKVSRPEKSIKYMKSVIVPDVYPQTIDGKTIVIVEISAGRQKPYYIKQDGITDGVYMRVSGTSRKADRAMTQEMYYESEGRSYDAVIRKDCTVSDEEIDKLCSDMKGVALANCKNAAQRQSVKNVTKNVLLNWGVLAEDEDGSIHPTNAYIYLTGQDTFLSKIQCGMFKGTTRAVFLDKRDYEGPLWQQAEEAFQFVLRNIRLGARIEGLYRQDIYELPPDSIRELIMNAVMNCSFLQSSHIQVAIYDDRLEITSPGGLMPGVTIDRMKKGYSQIRNRALAHAFNYMNLIEGWGTGIPRLFREMKEYGLAEPEFIDMEIALRINLYRANEMVQRSAEKVPDRAEKVPDRAEKVPDRAEKCRIGAGQLPKQQALIYQAITRNGKITSSEVEALLGIKQRRARALLKIMTESGVIRKVGTARSTKYVLKED